MSELIQIEEELLDPLPTMMPKWTAFMRFVTKNNVKILIEEKHAFTSEGKSLQKIFEINYNNNLPYGCLVTEAFGGFNNGNIPYNTNCCGEFPYSKASEALLSWKNFIEYKKELYNHIIDNHPDVKI